jgi:hypothetical protein
MYHYGARCFSEHQCNLKDGRNPCFNGGTCYVNYEPQRLLQDYVCICPTNYFGERCETQSAILGITYFYNQSDNILATVVQLFDINKNVDLHLKKQLVYEYQLPIFSLINYEQRLLPTIGLVKIYSANSGSAVGYYLLYVRVVSEQHMNVTFQLNRRNYCPHSLDILQLNKSISGE